MSRIATLRRMTDELIATQAVAKGVLVRARAAVVAGEAEVAAADEARQIVQVVAETIQEEAHDRIAGVVTRCLATVFDEPYEFKINFERARGRTEARLVFMRGGMALDPMDASGGGVIDVAAFALRLSCLMLARPAQRRTIILDEPFRFVSEEYRPALRAMLEGLVGELGVQFIVVTHMKELCTGHIVAIT